MSRDALQRIPRLWSKYSEVRTDHMARQHHVQYSDFPTWPCSRQTWPSLAATVQSWHSFSEESYSCTECPWHGAAPRADTSHPSSYHVQYWQCKRPCEILYALFLPYITFPVVYRHTRWRTLFLRPEFRSTLYLEIGPYLHSPVVIQ